MKRLLSNRERNIKKVPVEDVSDTFEDTTPKTVEAPKSKVQEALDDEYPHE
jgi:hypothetical protein